MKIIYDFGCNNGIDIPYYLKKADRVIVIEANPKYTQKIQRDYHNVIKNKKLIVVNKIITTGQSGEIKRFYVHRIYDVRSTFIRPQENEINDFEIANVETQNALELINEHGFPYYLKIDLEGYDEILLEYLLTNRIKPPFISAELSNIKIFSLLQLLGRYNSFNIVDGKKVHLNYRKCLIRAGNCLEPYSFQEHSAGPFGSDINEKWMTADNIIRKIALESCGWKDLHASNEIIAPENHSINLKKYILCKFSCGLLFKQ